MDINRYKRWKHFTIAESLPGCEWGTGGIGLADFNDDGCINMSDLLILAAYWGQCL